MGPPNPFVLYSLLAAIGLAGAVGDSLLYHAAKEPSRLGSLACGVVAWLLGIGLVYLFFRLDRHGLTSAVLVMIVVHAVATAVIDWWYFGGSLGVRQVVGFILAVAAVAILEGQSNKPAPPL